MGCLCTLRTKFHIFIRRIDSQRTPLRCSEGIELATPRNVSFDIRNITRYKLQIIQDDSHHHHHTNAVTKHRYSYGWILDSPFGLEN